jgi:hypothetical protein
MHAQFWSENPRGINLLLGLGVDGGILPYTFRFSERFLPLLKRVLRNSVGVCGLDYPAQDKFEWSDLVNMVTNLRVP